MNPTVFNIKVTSIEDGALNPLDRGKSTTLIENMTAPRKLLRQGEVQQYRFPLSSMYHLKNGNYTVSCHIHVTSSTKQSHFRSNTCTNSFLFVNHPKTE